MPIRNGTRRRLAPVVPVWLLLPGLLLVLSGSGRAADPPPPNAGPWPGVSVTDRQGWTLREVTLAWDADGRSLVVIRADGAEKLIAPGEVTMVVDREGRDITARVLGVPSDSNPDFESAPRPAADSRRGAREIEPTLFVVAGDFGGGWAELTGDWFRGLENGRFVRAGLRVGLSARRYLHLVYGHQSLGERAVYYAYDHAPVIADWSLDSYQVLMGGHSRPDPTARIRSATYLEGGVGIMRVTADEGWDSDSVSRFAFAAQAGIWLMPADNLALEFGLHLFYKPGWTASDEAGGATLGSHLAVMLFQ